MKLFEKFKAILRNPFVRKFIPNKFLKSLNWTKDDLKKILTFTIILLIGCFIINNFLILKIKIIQGRREHLDVSVSGSVDSDVSGSIDADVSGYLNTSIDGSIGVDNSSPYGIKIKS